MQSRMQDARWTYVFWALVFIYAAVFLIHPSFAPTDDFVFVKTLQAGKPILYYAGDFPYYDTAKIGRFTPLAAMEYNLALLFTSKPSPIWYYAIHAAQFLITILALVSVLSRFTARRGWIYLAVGLFVLTPGFAYSWFRMQLNERDLVFALALYLWAYFAYLDQPTFRWRLAAAWVAANLVIYYKETGFIIIGAMSFFYWLIALKEKRKDKTLMYFHAACLLSALAYVVIYAVYILPMGGVYSYAQADDYALRLVKNILNYTFVFDPVIMLLVFPLAGYRAYRVLFRRDAPNSVHDPLLAAAVAFVCAYFVLNLSGMYYFQPAYVLALPPLFFYLPRLIKKISWRAVVVACAALMVLNALPVGLHYIAYYKYLPYNFERAVAFVKRDIEIKHADFPPSVFLDGVNRGTGKFMYFIYSEFFRLHGLRDDEYDMKSNVETDIEKEGYFPFLEKVPTPFTVFKTGPLPQTQKGDYLILSSQSTDSQKSPENAAYIEWLKKDYDLVFATESRLAFPLVNLKNIGRYLLSLGAKPGERFLTISRHKPALESPDYYVFVKK